jgi:hypothetical protein
MIAHQAGRWGISDPTETGLHRGNCDAGLTVGEHRDQNQRWDTHCKRLNHSGSGKNCAAPPSLRKRAHRISELHPGMPGSAPNAGPPGGLSCGCDGNAFPIAAETRLDPEDIRLRQRQHGEWFDFVFRRRTSHSLLVRHGARHSTMPA